MTSTHDKYPSNLNDRKFQPCSLTFPGGMVYVNSEENNDTVRVVVKYDDGKIGYTDTGIDWKHRNTAEALPSIIGVARTIILSRNHRDLVQYVRQSFRGSRLRFECHHMVGGFRISYITNGTCWRVGSSHSVYRHPRKIERGDGLLRCESNIKFNGHNFIGDDSDWIIAMSDFGVPGVLRHALDVRRTIGRVNRITIRPVR